jgi:hypothetical protein
MKRKVTRLQLAQMVTAWASDFYLVGNREFVVEISEDGKSFHIEVVK